MPRSKGFLLLYSLMMSTLCTSVILGVVLRPADGWGPKFRQIADKLFGNQPIAAVTLATPTPQEASYQIQARYDEAGLVLHGHETVRVPQTGLDDVPFYLYSISDHPMQIHDVLLNGQPAQVTVTDTSFTLHAKKSAVPQTISFAFDTTISKAPTRFGQWDGVTTLGYWYPILAVVRDGKWVPRPTPLGFGDPFLMDEGNYDVELDSPAELKWYASGLPSHAPTPAKSGAGRTLWKWTGDQLRNFALVGGANFHETSFETGTGTKVIVATVDGDVLARTKELAQSAVTTYTSKMGLDPYPVLNVLELPAKTVYAHELPNFALFSHDLWDYDDPDHWIAHEIGHNWFYNAVGDYEAETPWLDEGLADYSSLLETEARLGSMAYDKAMADDWARFKQYDTYSPYPAGTPAGVKNGITAAPYGTYSTSQALYYYNYLRPILMYHDLRRHMGDTQFFKFLRQFYEKNVLHTATKSSLEQALSDVAPDELPRMKMWLDMPNDQLLKQVSEDFAR